MAKSSNNSLLSAYEKLKKARALVKAGWCQYRFSRKHKGKMQYCISGALGKFEALDHFWIDCLEAGAATVDPGYYLGLSLVGFNDKADRTKAEVLAAFDVAIELAKP